MLRPTTFDYTSVFESVDLAGLLAAHSTIVVSEDECPLRRFPPPSPLFSLNRGARALYRPLLGAVGVLAIHLRCPLDGSRVTYRLVRAERECVPGCPIQFPYEWRLETVIFGGIFSYVFPCQTLWQNAVSRPSDLPGIVCDLKDAMGFAHDGSNSVHDSEALLHFTGIADSLQECYDALVAPIAEALQAMHASHPVYVQSHRRAAAKRLGLLR